MENETKEIEKKEKAFAVAVSWSNQPCNVLVKGTKGTKVNIIDQLINEVVGSGEIGKSGQVIIANKYWNPFLQVVIA